MKKSSKYLLLSGLLSINILSHAEAVYDFILTQEQCSGYNGVWDINAKVCVNNILRSNADCSVSSINGMKGIWYNYQKDNINTAACIYPELEQRSCSGSGLSYDQIPSCVVSSTFFDQRCLNLRGTQKYDCTLCYRNNQFWDINTNSCGTNLTCNIHNLMQLKIDAAAWDQTGKFVAIPMDSCQGLPTILTPTIENNKCVMTIQNPYHPNYATTQYADTETTLFKQLYSSIRNSDACFNMCGNWVNNGGQLICQPK